VCLRSCHCHDKMISLVRSVRTAPRCYETGSLWRCLGRYVADIRIHSQPPIVCTASIESPSRWNSMFNIQYPALSAQPLGFLATPHCQVFVGVVASVIGDLTCALKRIVWPHRGWIRRGRETLVCVLVLRALERLAITPKEQRPGWPPWF
jgi:hypothetical protein